MNYFFLLWCWSCLRICVLFQSLFRTVPGIGMVCYSSHYSVLFLVLVWFVIPVIIPYCSWYWYLLQFSPRHVANIRVFTAHLGKVHLSILRGIQGNIVPILLILRQLHIYIMNLVWFFATHKGHFSAKRHYTHYQFYQKMWILFDWLPFVPLAMS